MGIAHGHTESCEADHPDVVVVITDGHNLLWNDASEKVELNFLRGIFFLFVGFYPYIRENI